MTTAATQRQLDEALTRLLAGQPAHTDGRLTVANLCLEAGVGRDSFYRSPTIRARFAAACANHQAHQPELVRLREQLTAQRAEANAAARRNAETIRALEQTITTYANQIQTLALHAAELTQDNQRLREQLSRSGNLRTLPTTATTSRR
jgi:DNA-binding protein H-NS